MQPEQELDGVVERFLPTSGWVMGVLGLVMAGVLLVGGLLAGSASTALGLAILAVLWGLLVWASLLRPGVAATSRDLVLRGMFHTDRIPLAAIEHVGIGRVLVVTAGGRRYVSPAIGHSMREVAMSHRPGGSAAPAPHVDYVEGRIAHLARESRDRLGIRADSPEQAALAADVRRTWAWPAIVAAALLALAFVTWLVV